MEIQRHVQKLAWTGMPNTLRLTMLILMTKRKQVLHIPLLHSHPILIRTVFTLAIIDFCP